MQCSEDLFPVIGKSETSTGAGIAKENGGFEGKNPSLIPSISSY